MLNRVYLGVLMAVIAAATPFNAADQSQHPNTDWFVKAGYGVFVHYLNGLQNDPDRVHSLGKQTSWDECVNEFDTERFADAMQEAGAGYVIFTVMQLSRHMIAPNATYDRITGYAPGEACSTRDLIEDLYQSLHKRNIPLMLYFTGDGPSRDPKAGPAYGCGAPVSTEFVQKWADTFREYGERYGDKIAGVWCDGSYEFIGYDQEKLGILAQGLRAGSDKRIIAMNPGVEMKAYSPYEDYTCGEQNVFYEIPAERYLNGEQWHILSFLSKTQWGEPGTGYTKAQLADYVYQVNRRGGVVSIDIALFRNGEIDRSQLEMLKAVRKELREGKDKPPVPPGNLAFGKQSRLLSLDGSHPLIVNSGKHHPWLGVDGKSETVALAAEEWPWTYEVDLIDTLPLNRIKVTFGKGYATDFEFRVSTDGKEWKSVAARSGHDGSPFEAKFDPTPARYVRVSALKPNGPDQPGGQMSVAELEVYSK